MKIAILNKSDSTGGAAVVTLRLAEALRAKGHDVTMIVTEKLTSHPWVKQAGTPVQRAFPFVKERLSVWMHNRFDRESLFKIDPASSGLDLASMPEVREADAILVNWVNQGMLSLRGMRRLLGLGKPVVWTMHDMWCFTGICHHSGTCTRYLRQCGHCPLLKDAASGQDLSRMIWHRKEELYPCDGSLAFVAVSRWLAEKARHSSLLYDLPVKVIPNAFELDKNGETVSDTAQALVKRLDDIRKESGTAGVSGENQKSIMVAFGAARLDDPIKGLPILRKAFQIISHKHPELASGIRLVAFGTLKNPHALDDMAVPVVHLGRVPADDIPEIYRRCDVVVSTSHYETLPGTLVEGQAWGAVPVAFDHGGQSDIIDHRRNGYLARWSEDHDEGAARIAEGIVWAASADVDKEMMRNDVRHRFDAGMIADRYVELIQSMRKKE